MTANLGLTPTKYKRCTCCQMDFFFERFLSDFLMKFYAVWQQMKASGGAVMNTKPKKYTNRLRVPLDDNLRAELVSTAFGKNISVNEAIRTAIREWISRA
jgi:hypothetical protein